jgi:proQ activator of osmoprotectant transporter proP superfamily
MAEICRKKSTDSLHRNKTEMTQETALGAALKSAVQTMSKKKQTDMIADHIYSKYDVFKRFKPLAVGIDQDLVAALPQFDPSLIARVLANHCRRPRYLKSLARGGKRFDLNNRFKGEVSPEEQAIAQQHPAVQQDLAAQAARKAAAQEEQPETASAADVSPAKSETPAV